MNLECTSARNPGGIARRIAGETILGPIHRCAGEVMACLWADHSRAECKRVFSHRLSDVLL